MRLNAVEKQAIIYSIKDKWMPAYKDGAEGEDLTCCDNCMLCTCFHWKKRYGKCYMICGSCPIKIKTGRRGCEDTPFESIEGHPIYYMPRSGYVGAELRYLISFLPIEERAIFFKEMEEA